MLGTPIQDLNKQQQMEEYQKIQELHNIGYNSMQHSQMENGHNVAHTVHQAQHDPYYDIEENYNYPQFINTPKQFNVSQLPELDDDDMFDLTNDNNSSSAINLNLNIPEMIKEPIIILILFVILSQPAIQSVINKYLSSVIKMNNGVHNIKGIFIYGLILSIAFALIKKFIKL